MNISSLVFAINVGVALSCHALVVTTAVDEDVSPGTGLSLREAIDQVASGGTITFDASMSGQTCVIDPLLGSLSINGKSMTIDASALAEHFVIEFEKPPLTDPPPESIVILITPSHNPQVTIKHLHVKNSTDSALVLGASCQATIDDCIFENTGEFFWFNASGANNQSVNGGAILAKDQTVLTVTRTSFLGCRSARGGAIHVEHDSSLNISLCMFSRCEADTEGGAVWVSDTVDLTVARTTFASNQATKGGSIFQMGGFANSTHLIDHCTFSGNSSSSSSVYESSTNNLTFTHCTVFQNPVVSGQAIHLPSATGEFIEFSHNIIAYNLNGSGNPKNYTGPANVSSGYNLSDSADLGTAQIGDQWGIHPLLAPLAKNGGRVATHMPYINSPAIDAGNPAISGAPGVDQRGKSRIKDGNRDGVSVIDIGAYEAPTATVVTSLDDVIDGTGLVTLREAVASAPSGSRIVFASNLNNGVIRLATSAGGVGTPLLIDKDITLDATGLPEGIEISGVGETSLMTTQAGTTSSLHAITLKNGSSTTNGGAVHNNGDLLLDMCTFHGNTANLQGGAIRNSTGHLHLHNATFTDNTAAFGGAISDDSAAPSTFQFEFTTIYDNEAGTSAAGLYLGSSHATFYFTILAENLKTSGSTDNIFQTVATTLISYGCNVEDNTEAGFTHTKDSQSLPSQLSSLNDNGGFVKTCAQSAGPAADISSYITFGNPDPTPPFDARGYGRLHIDYFNRVDAGAYQHQESDGIFSLDDDDLPDHYELWHGLNPYDETDALLDHDGDGTSTAAEFANESDPFAPDFILVSVVPDKVNDTVTITWKCIPNSLYDLEYSENLTGWIVLSTHSPMINQFTITAVRSGWDFNTDPLGFFRAVRRP